MPNTLISAKELKFHVRQFASSGTDVELSDYIRIRRYRVWCDEIRKFEEEDAARNAIVIHTEQGTYMPHFIGLKRMTEAVKSVSVIAECSYLVYTGIS